METRTRSGGGNGKEEDGNKKSEDESLSFPSTPNDLSGLVKELGLIPPITTTTEGLLNIQEGTQYLIPATESQEELIITLLDPNNTKNNLNVNVEPTEPTKEINFEIEDKNSGNKGEGEAIMENLTGFGNPTQMGSGLNMAQPPIQMQNTKPYVRIIEQPAGNKLRFRYECEGRSAGALQGEKSTSENKTYPTIQIVGYKGPAVVVVSCVEEKAPYRTHPHNLVGRDGICKKGVCSMDINNDDMICPFQNLGIQCVRRKDAPASLVQRGEIRVDPFKQGFGHKNSSINLNAVRLCFQAFLKNGNSLTPLEPVVSSVIKDRKSHTDLQIIDYSDDKCTVDGAKKILIFTERVSKEDIEIHFTQYAPDGDILWHGKGDFSPTSVHKQYAISFMTPPYYNKDIKNPVKVSMNLYKPSEQTTSDPIEFTYLPIDFVFPHPSSAAVEPSSVAIGVNNSSNTKKRGKPQGQQDELSSGQVLGPQKISAAQLRHGGGNVTVVDNASPSNEDHKQRLGEMLNVAAAAGGGGGGGQRVIAKASYGRQRNNSSLDDPNYQSTTNAGYDTYAYPSDMYQQHSYGQHLQNAPDQQQQSQINPPPDLASLENVNMSDLVDIELSENMVSNMILQRGGDHQNRPNFHTQTSQLQTPDVSSNILSMDSKRNDFNKL